jgi:hypothetical protein
MVKKNFYFLFLGAVCASSAMQQDLQMATNAVIQQLPLQPWSALEDRLQVIEICKSLDTFSRTFNATANHQVNVAMVNAMDGVSDVFDNIRIAMDATLDVEAVRAIGTLCGHMQRNRTRFIKDASRLEAGLPLTMGCRRALDF